MAASSWTEFLGVSGAQGQVLPRCDFLNAMLRNNPSYTWRSLLFAQNIVKEGLQWRVGNGKHIRVWGDKWLPAASTHKVMSPRVFLDADTRVSDLIGCLEDDPYFLCSFCGGYLFKLLIGDCTE